MKRPSRGSTLRQYAYATRRLSPGSVTTKKEAALLSGYSQTMAENVKAKIENTDGYQNAIQVLAHESNNLLLEVMAEFKTRGLSDFSNKDLNAALNAISGAWDRIEKTRAPNKLKTPEGNPLRGVFTERVTTRERTATIETIKEETANADQGEIRDAEVVTKVEEDPMDF